jgi:nucleoside-diphosphate-sugar epimerase
VTIEGAARVLEAMALSRGGRLIFVSSLSVYAGCAPAGGTTIVDENAPLENNGAGRSSYARAKSAADALAQRYLNHPNFALTIVRPGIVYGPGMANPLTGVAIPLHGMLWLAVGDGKKLLPLIHIDDLVQALIRIAQTSEARGKIYNLVDAMMPTCDEYLKLYRQTSGDRRPIVRLPLRTMLPFLRATDWVVRQLSGRESHLAQTAERAMGRVIFSAECARQELGIEPKTALAVGLRNVVGYDQN